MRHIPLTSLTLLMHISALAVAFNVMSIRNPADILKSSILSVPSPVTTNNGVNCFHLFFVTTKVGISSLCRGYWQGNSGGQVGRNMEPVQGLILYSVWCWRNKSTENFSLANLAATTKLTATPVELGTGSWLHGTVNDVRICQG